MLRGALATLALVSASGMAGAANRCLDAKGRVTYQDAACEAAVAARPVDTTDAFSTKVPRATAPGPAAPSGSGGDAYANARGSWRGPAQFQLTIAGVRDGDAQAIAPMVLELKPTGEIVGVISQAGCTASGLTTQFVAPYIASIDLSMKGCTDARFNVRFSGYLHSSVVAKEAKLTLNALTVRLPNMKMQQASIEAVLKR